MSEFYQRVQAMAKRQIADKGGSAILKKKVNTGTAYNPVYTYTEYPIKVVIVDYTADERRNTAIQSNDRKVLIEGTGVVPTVGDILLLSTKNMSVIAVESVATDGATTVLYKIQARI